MTDHSDLQWNKEEIAVHLKSAMDTLAPDVLDRIDLKTPQDFYMETPKAIKLYRRFRTAAVVAAACFFVGIFGGGVSAFQNSRVDSLIGIDVNPSIELSVNRKDKVLKAEPLNDDAEEILSEMELKGVDLNIAVNAVIGSMVRHGYLDDLDNAILVTVANDDVEKASLLREDVVEDIEQSLEEHKVSAIVYDQQTSVNDEVKDLAKEYGISYGKAYFLKELVDENNLSDEDMKTFSGMTMEEVAREITERSYNIRNDKNIPLEKSLEESEETKKKEVTSAPSTEETTIAESSGETVPEKPKQPESKESTAAPAVTVPEESEEFETEADSGGKKVKVDYVDYDGGLLNIVFKEKVKWKNPTISVSDENGESYSAKITDTSSESCEIEIRGLPGAKSCTFILGGVAVKEGGSYGRVKGYFDSPDIAGEAGDDENYEAEDEESADSEENTEAASQPVETAPVPTEDPTAPPPQQSDAQISEGETPPSVSVGGTAEVSEEQG